MGYFDPEAVDLQELASEVRAELGAMVEGAVVGRTAVRDEVARALGCSLVDAERMVDTMAARGFITQETEASGRVVWRIGAA
jgi:hypothetical protein